MSFITVENAAGIVHSSIHSDWDDVDANRAVLVTQGAGKSGKFFIQDIITQDGVTTIGQPYFIGQLSLSGSIQGGDYPTTPHVRYMGNDRFLVAVAGPVFQYGAANGNAAFAYYHNAVSSNSHLIPWSLTWQLYLVRRDPVSGEFSTLGSTSVPDMSMFVGSGMGTTFTARNLFPTHLEKLAATTARLHVQGYPSASVNINSRPVSLYVNIGFTDDILSVSTTNFFIRNTYNNTSAVGQTGMTVNHVVNTHEKRLRDGTVVFAFDRGTDGQQGRGTTSGILYNCVTLNLHSAFLSGGGIAVGTDSPDFLGSGAHTYPTAGGLLLRSLPPGSYDTGAEFLLHAAAPAPTGGYVSLSHRFAAMGAQCPYPLDTAWITDNVGVTVGIARAISTADNQQNCLSKVDVAAIVCGAMNPAEQFFFQPINLYFRQMINAQAGLAGAFDPITLPWLVDQNRQHVKKMIKRVDDKTFLLIGVFNSNVGNGSINSRVGVITVKIPE